MDKKIYLAAIAGIATLIIFGGVRESLKIVCGLSRIGSLYDY